MFSDEEKFVNIIVSLISGLLFGLGLIFSGMADPSKVLGFLDLAGLWDPSLAFVMGGAVLVGSAFYPLATRRTKSISGAPMRVPVAAGVDRRLVLGGVTFGVGWGLDGYCPGPALVSVAYGGLKPLVFVFAMLAGMGIFEIRERSKAKATPVAEPN